MDIAEMVEKGFAAYSNEDWNLLESIYAPDFVWQFPGAVIRGRDQVLRRHRAEQRACRHTDTIERLNMVGDLCYVEHVVDFTIDQRRILWPMIAVFAARDDQLITERTYWGEIPNSNVPGRW